MTEQEGMKAISLHQPWASLVAIGAKKIETRSWRTPYRGLLAIHAAKTYPAYARDFAEDSPATSALIAGMTRHHLPYRHEFPDDLPRGVIVAVACLVECRATGAIAASAAQPADPWPRAWVMELSEQERAFGNFEPSRYGWMLEDVRPLAEPVACRGQQGIWPVTADVLAQIEQQLGGISCPS